MAEERNPSLSGFQLRVVAVVAVVLVAALAWAAATAVLVVFMGILFGVLFSGLAGLVQRCVPLPYRVALTVAMLVLVVAGGLAVVFFVPRAAAETRRLREQVPQAISQVQDRLASTAWGQAVLDGARAPEAWIPEPQTLTSGAAGVFTGLMGAAGGAVAAVFLGLFIAVEPGLYKRGIVGLVSPARRGRARDVVDQIGRVLRRWLLAKMISMAMVGVLTGLGLWLLDIPLAFSLALLASVLTFIPNVGPVISAVPAVLLAFVEGPSQALYVVLLYVGVQAVESYGITPFVERETVSLPPAVTLAAQLVFGLLAGLAGVIVATPLVAVLIVLVQTVYMQDVLGDRYNRSIARDG